ncbi:MAG: LysE family transporter [Pseudomonadota bacterium]
MPELLIALAPVLFGAALAQLGPGPSLLIVAQTALTHGLRPALSAVLGVTLGYAIWASVFAAGVGVLLAANPGLLIVLKAAGGAVLLLLSWQGLRRVKQGFAPGSPPPPHPFRAALWVNLTNPKAALIWAATSVYLTSLGGPAVVAGSVAITCSAAVVYGTYAVLFAQSGARRLYDRAANAVSLGFSALLGVFGAALLFQAARDAMGRR